MGGGETPDLQRAALAPRRAPCYRAVRGRVVPGMWDARRTSMGRTAMLARLILLLVQLAVGWFAAPHILRYLPKFGGVVDLFVYAIVVALLVTVVGFVGSLVLQG